MRLVTGHCEKKDVTVCLSRCSCSCPFCILRACTTTLPVLPKQVDMASTPCPIMYLQKLLGPMAPVLISCALHALHHYDLRQSRGPSFQGPLRWLEGWIQLYSVDSTCELQVLCTPLHLRQQNMSEDCTRVCLHSGNLEPNCYELSCRDVLVACGASWG